MNRCYPAGGTSGALRARYLITVADDFVVDVYRNGSPVPDARRVLLQEIFGATVERINVEVRRGDWLVFNVVNNRLRWGGWYYFAVAGCFAPNEFGFVSQLGDGAWSACDAPGEVKAFISIRTHGRMRPALAVSRPWDQGLDRMREHAGASWDGAPVWGSSRNTWIKVIVE